jgi:hypothetical protein
LRRAVAFVGALLPVALVALAVTASPGAGEVVQQEGLRVSFEAKAAPKALPRAGGAPVSVTLAGAISETDGTAPPQLTTIELAINRSAKLDYEGLPTCNYHQIQPASTGEAIEACPKAVVGEGTFSAAVLLPEQSPFPSQGKIVAFNGLLHGRHVIFAHIFGTNPLPQSSLIVFSIGHASGEFGLLLSATLPQVAAEWGHVSTVSLTLGKTFEYRGRPRGYLNAGCPAPSGFTIATSPFVRASFSFDDGKVLQSTLVRNCRVAVPRKQGSR